MIESLMEVHFMEMVFVPRDAKKNQGSLYKFVFNLEDCCEESGQHLELTESDIAPLPKIELDFSELESIQCGPSVQYQLKDLSYPTIEIDLDELQTLEDQLRKNRKNMDWFDDERPFCYHGTKSVANAESICRDGWRVGSGNALGTGIYFGYKVNSKKKNKAHIPVPGKLFSSQTTADGYAWGNGALVITQIDWGKVANLSKPADAQAFQKWKNTNRNKLRGNNGDYITDWALSAGYHSVKQPNSGVGVMLQPRFEYTKKYWKTPRIKICYVYSLSDKKVKTVCE